MQGFKKHLEEKLKASDDMGDYVKDFQDSDAPQFKGKSQKKRQQMAVAAKLAAERNEEIELDEKAYVSSLSPELGRKGSHDVTDKDGKVVKSYPYTKQGMKAAQAHLSKMKEEVEQIDEIQISWRHKTQKHHTIKHPDGSHWGVFDHGSYGTKGHEIRKVRDSEGKPIKAADSRRNHSTGYKSGMGHPSDAAKEWAKKHGGKITNHKLKESAEQIDEISRDLATRAAQGFADKADKAHAKKDYAGFKKGEAGRKLAIAKLQGRTKVPAVARRVEEVELDEQTQYDLVEAYLLENNIDVDTLSVEQLDEIIGKAIGGAFKLGAKAAVGAGRLAKKAIVNKQGNVRGTQAAKNDAMKAKLDKLRKQRTTEVQRQKLKKDVERAQAKLSATKSRA